MRKELMTVFIMPINRVYENMLLSTEFPAAAETGTDSQRSFYDKDPEQTFYITRYLLHRIHAAERTR